MSIEIAPDEQHYFACKWGRFNNSEADPRRGIEHLMLITPDIAERIIDSPEPGTRGGTMSGTGEQGRKFVHLEYEGKRWTWELFEAHWWDDHGPEIMIGRWPD